MVPWPKRWLVNLIVKRVKKLIPAWRIDGAIGFRAARVKSTPGTGSVVSLSACGGYCIGAPGRAMAVDRPRDLSAAHPDCARGTFRRCARARFA